MINATVAAQNVINFKVEHHRYIKTIVDELLNEISMSIEFHSKQGFTHLMFVPYTNARFPSHDDKVTASELFEKALIENGFTVTRNDISQNILAIDW